MEKLYFTYSDLTGLKRGRIDFTPEEVQQFNRYTDKLKRIKHACNSYKGYFVTAYIDGKEVYKKYPEGL